MPTILYAEDDPQMADLVQILFRRDAPEIGVEVAPNGLDCLARMANGSFDLLLLDMVLPGRDGLAVLSELSRRGDTTPVIVLSSHGQYEQTVSVLRAGAIDCIDKKAGRFLDTAKIVRRYLEPAGGLPEALTEGEVKTVALLERDEQTALELTTILGRECPRLRVQTITHRTAWDRWRARQLPCDALVLTDNWAFEDVTDVLRDFRSAHRHRPAILICREERIEVVIAAYALGCSDCVVQQHGYQFELARSLNYLLREPRRSWASPAAS